MPRLTAQQMQVLNNYVAGHPGVSVVTAQIPAFDRNEVACWKWALFGLANNVTYNGANTSTTIHRPGEFFTGLVTGIPVDPQSFWHQYANAVQQVSQQVQAFNPDAAHGPNDWTNWRNWRLQVMTTACNLLCTQLGFITNGVPTDYRLVMHYDDANPQGVPYGPNETHWWIEIPLQNNNFVCIETFPQQNNPPTLQFRFNARYSNNGNVTIPINNLLQSHINAIPF